MPLNELSFLFDDNPNPMLIYELSTLRILKVNKAAIDCYGYSQQEFLTMSTDDLQPVIEPKTYKSKVSQNDSTKLPAKDINNSGIFKHQHKNGEFIYSDITCHDVKYDHHDCKVVVAVDVTEKMHFQEELVWTKNNLEALINNTTDQIWSVDKDTRYVYMNNSYRNKVARLTGIEPKEGDYSYLHKNYAEQDIDKWKGYYSRAILGERYVIVSESIDADTLQVLSYEISFNPIYKSKDEITGIGCFARDITERLKIENSITDQNARLRYIASLTSHELRRPVASMLGLINIMDRENFYNPDNKEIIEHLLTVGNEIDEVIRLIVDNSFTNGLSAKYQSPKKGFDFNI